MVSKMNPILACAAFLALLPLASLAQSDTLPATANPTGHLNTVLLARNRRVWQRNYERTLHQDNIELKSLSRRRANLSDQLDLTDQWLSYSVNEPNIYNEPQVVPMLPF